MVWGRSKEYFNADKYEWNNGIWTNSHVSPWNTSEKVTKSAILELKTEKGNIHGHKQCSDFICDSVAELLENPFEFNIQNQEVLLKEVEEVFTKDDNNMLLKLPSKEEIKEIISNSNLHAAPGCDGLTNYFYLKLVWPEPFQYDGNQRLSLEYVIVLRMRRQSTLRIWWRMQSLLQDKSRSWSLKTTGGGSRWDCSQIQEPC